MRIRILIMILFGSVGAFCSLWGDGGKSEFVERERVAAMIYISEAIPPVENQSRIVKFELINVGNTGFSVPTNGDGDLFSNLAGLTIYRWSGERFVPTAKGVLGGLRTGEVGKTYLAPGAVIEGSVAWDWDESISTPGDYLLILTYSLGSFAFFIDEKTSDLTPEGMHKFAISLK